MAGIKPTFRNRNSLRNPGFRNPGFPFRFPQTGFRILEGLS